MIRTRYYLTVKRACRCSRCGGKLCVNDEIVFRKDWPVTLHVRCADEDPLIHTALLRWEKDHRCRRG